jgi:hypothetical protein
MLSIKYYQKIIENEKVKYSNEELGLIIDFLSRCAELEVSIKKQGDERNC